MTASGRPMIELLTQLRSGGAVLSVVDGTLKCSAPKGLLTPELREELTAQKPEIMAFLEASQRASRESAQETSILRIDRSGVLPLSYAQQRLWFLGQLDPESTAYNIGAVLRVTGELNVSVLERSLRAIVCRHEGLRTCFRQNDGAPVAVIFDGAGLALERVDWEELTSGGTVGWQDAVCAMNRRRFDTERGPLIRASMVCEDATNYLLVIAIHHMVCDGWSMGVFADELSETYTALLAGREPKLPELTIQYSDYAAWQRRWLDSGRLAAQLPYWKKQLEGAPPVLTFPPDHPRPATESFRGTRAKVMVPAELTTRLEVMSQRHGVTLFMTLLSAFNVLLARYTGQKDIVVGTPSANRGRPELNALIGFFVNNLVLRTDLNGEPTFTELLGRVREVTLKAYEHQDVPFDQLVNALRTERSLEHSPLFQVMFALQNFALNEVEIPGATMKQVELDIDSARFDLTVEIFPKGGELKCFFDYKADLYEAETIARMQRHYLAILESVVVDQEQKIGAIGLLSEDERRRSLEEWNDTKAEIPEATFVQRFESHAEASPGQVALRCGDEVLTYAELEARAERIAALLRSRGARPGELIALFLERSAEMVAAMLGIAKSGAAYVPLDPAYPAGRIANILEQAKPLLVLTTRSLLASLPEGSGELVSLDDPLESVFAAAWEGNPAAATLDDLAYVIFTSGSTGKPKGVQIPHRALTNFLESMRREPGLSADDVLLAVTTVSFDIAALELLLPLWVGGTVCLSLRANDPESLLAELARYRPSVMQATPATWKMLIASGWRGGAAMKILCGGEALDTELARSLVVRCDELWNMYGPTETTIWSAALKIEDAGMKSIPVGRPIANTSFYVLDEAMQPVPQGVAGELWIGGDGLARGYLDREDLTAERFVACRFVAEEGARMYRTGDLVRSRQDGTLDFFGRLDHQVKLRGYRIELGEIEALMRECAGIADAVTVLREDGADKRLVGYLTYDGAEPPMPAEVRGRLREALPEYMVPSALVFLKELPRLPNGKLDRSALPSPESSTVENEQAFVAPDTDVQEAVAAAFGKVLETDRIGVDSNFFDLGANSLSLVRVHVELNRHIEPGIPLLRFFQYPTVRLLARFMESSGQTLSLQSAGRGQWKGR
jgi:amino acid adenylation domain-containing protein